MADMFYPDETYGEALARRAIDVAATRRVLGRFAIGLAPVKLVAEALFAQCLACPLRFRGGVTR